MSSLAQRQDEKDKAAEPANGRMREWLLGPEIDFYLRSLAKRLKKPLEIRHLRVHPANIADELVLKLKTYEKELVGPNEELAAFEFGDSKPGRSAFDVGRRKLSNLIAVMAMPLADVTQAYDLDLSLKIGKQLVEPVADDGLGMYATVETHSTAESGVHAILKRRFATRRDDPSLQPGQDIEVGMTLVCRPGKIDPDQANDDGTSRQFIRLAQGDPNTLIAQAAGLQQAIEQHKENGDKHSAAERDAMQQASAALNTFLRIMWDEERLAALDNDQHGVIGTTSTADMTLPPGALLDIGELDRALEGLKNIPSSLGVAIEHFREALATTFAADSSHHMQALEAARKPPAIVLTDDDDSDDKFIDLNHNGIDDRKEKQYPVFIPIAEQAAIAAQALVIVKQQQQQQEQLTDEPEPKQPTARGILSNILGIGDPQPQDS